MSINLENLRVNVAFESQLYARLVACRPDRSPKAQTTAVRTLCTIPLLSEKGGNASGERSDALDCPRGFEAE